MSKTPDFVKRNRAPTGGSTVTTGISSPATFKGPATASLQTSSPLVQLAPPQAQQAPPNSSDDTPIDLSIPRLNRSHLDAVSQKSLPSNRPTTDRPATLSIMESHLTAELVNFEARYNSEARKEEKLQELVSFPSDNFTVITTPKIHRTDAVNNQSLTGLEPFAQTVFGTLKSNWKTVKFNYTKYQKAENGSVFDLQLPGYEETTPQRTPSGSALTVDARPLLSLNNNDLHFQLMTPHTGETDKLNANARNAGRLPVFRYYEPDYDWEPGTAASLCYRVERQDNPNNLLNQFRAGAIQFLVEVKDLSFHLGDIEPFFCTLSLYDIASKKKISESFHFAENLDKIKEILPTYTETPPVSRSAIFTVRHPSDNIYLVLQIEKVFCGELEVSTEPYSKAGAKKDAKDKEVAKAKEKAVAEFKKLAESPNVQSRALKYRQSFGWACLPVFDSAGQLLLTASQTFAFKHIHPQQPKENICDLIAEMKEKGAKRKDLHGSCVICVTPVPEDIPKLDISLDPIIRENATEKPSGLPAIEIQEFLTTPVLATSWTFVNNLYVYPQTLNFSSHERKFKNILIKMELKANDDPASPPLKAIFAQGDLRTEAFSQVLYHNKTPAFQDEWKIKLPVTLTPKFHLLFTFYHLVATTKKKKKGKEDQEMEFLCGYSYLPLYPDSKFVTHNQGTSHGIPVITSKLEAGYLTLDEKAKKNVQYLDGGKPVFHLSFQLISTVYSQDPALADLYRFADGPDSDLEKSLNGLRRINDCVAVQNFPFILNLIFSIVAKKSKLGLVGVQCIIRLLNIVKSKVSEPGQPRAPLLEDYVGQVFDIDENAKNNVSLLSSLPLSVWMAYRSLKAEKKQAEEDMDLTDLGPVSWFFFEIISKSLTLYLEEHKQSLDEDNRATRFEPKSDAGMQDPRSAILRLTAILSESIKKSLAVVAFNAAGLAAEAAVRELNKSCAMFIRDLVAVIDRGQAIKMIQTHLREMAELSNDIVVANLKFDFLRIIADYEHYVPMNLPLAFSLDSLPDVSSNTLAKHYLETHPLSTLLVEEVMKTMQPDTNKAVRNIAVGTLYDTLIKHDFDARYQDQTKRERVAGLYFLLLIRTLDNIEKGGPVQEFVTELKTTDPDDPTLVAKMIEKRDFFICLLYLLKACDRNFLRSWWKREITSRILLFLQVLSGCVSAFEYMPGKNLQRRKRVVNIEAAQFKKDKKVRTDEENKALNQQLSCEASILVLDVLEDLISDYQKELASVDPVSPLMDSVFKLLLQLMKTRQSEKFLHFLYASLRSFFIKFPDHFFKIKTSYCGDVAYQIFRHCSSTLPSIRIEAATLFYLLLKHNHRTIGNFGRMRIQAITALSRVVEAGALKDIGLMKQSLARISTYALHEYSLFMTADEDTVKGTELLSSYVRAGFARGVQDLCNTLSKILQDTIQVSESKEKADKETIAELYFRIAQGYTHTPDLRVQWLQSLALYHSKEGNFAEAAICTVHVVALVCDFLQTRQGINIESHILRRICPTIAEFVGDEEGTCQSSVFSELGLQEELHNAIDFLESAEMYEFAAQLYKVLIPLYERANSYGELSAAHRQLDRLWDKVHSTNEGRLFGKFFRVGFHGTLFDKMDGKEFVYKTPKLTHLFEFSDRLKNFHSKAFGEGNVIVLPDSNPPDRTKFLPGKVYLQITFVEPYFSTTDDLTTRTTYFDRSTRLAKFVFETPFSKSGKAHSDNITEQYKRKTIITTEHPFPYMMTRLPVSNKTEIIISPIQNAIDNLYGQRNKLLLEINRQPKPDTKTLQQVLQGSALPQVNPGVRLICEGFLANKEVLGSYPKEAIDQLAGALRAFLKGCKDGLELNRRLIEDEAGQLFHREVEAGFRQLSTQVLEHLEKAGLAKSDETSSDAGNDDDDD